MTAVLVAECIGCVPVGQRTKGATSTLCTSCELDWLLRAAGLFEAAEKAVAS